MATFLFDKIVFGPVKSRRFGKSLGINLLPENRKVCSFNCLYCECGWTDNETDPLPASEDVINALELRLKMMASESGLPDTITFAGNGEPTLHPDFLSIMQHTVKIRDIQSPETKIAVLSNATRIHKKDVVEGLLLADYNVLKLDAGTDRTLNLINNPKKQIKVSDLVNALKVFNGNLIIQTLFFRGMFAGETIDNTTSEEVGLWLEHLQKISPREVMIYSLERDTAAFDLEKINRNELESIALKVENLGIKTQVY